MLNNFIVYFLGTGGTHPTPQNNPPAIAVKLDSEYILLDCGEGCVKGLYSLGISPLKITRIIITHFHGDHFFGLPSLLHTMALYERKKDLEIIGPIGTIQIIKNLVKIFPYYPSYNLIAREVSPGNFIEFDKYIIRFGPADHTIEAISVRIDEKAPKYKLDPEKIKELRLSIDKIKALKNGGKIIVGDRIIGPLELSSYEIFPRSLVYTGDTRPLRELISFSKNATVLIHDATYTKEYYDVSREYGHSTAEDAAKVASVANVDFLFLFHYSPRIKDKRILIKEARRIFPRTALAMDLTYFPIPRKYID
ncbi:MAG TPA: ribonuclease Z, partial [candidate division WOR-3 bacterium]|nr:ribonuclease Z [candidate division WOR-3 bacterium]